MMMYDTLLARSFSKQEQKKLGYGAMVACFLIVLSFCSVFKPYLSPLQVLNLRLSMEASPKLQVVSGTCSSPLKTKNEETVTKNTLVNAGSSQQLLIDADVVTENIAEIICNTTTVRSDFCEIKGRVRVDGNSSTVFVVSSETNTLARAANTSWSIRPYARKGDMTAMSLVREWKVKLVSDNQDIPQCRKSYNVPGILFSLGGYSGNHFHSFTDIIVPLFATARPFVGEVKFLMTDMQSRLVRKFETLLKSLSGYEFIDIDKRDDGIHCFNSLIVGLKHRSTKELSIDHSSSYTMKDFRQFLRCSYRLNKTTAINIKNVPNARPQLLIISRKWSRAFTNVNEIATMAETLAYEVVVAEPNADISRFAEIMNSCDVVMGVHGAGLTNMIFLPENAVLIQIIPFGGAEWVSKTCFEDPLKGMNINYLEYKIRLEESTLIEQYPLDHVVLNNPYEIQKKGWIAFKSIYLDKQNVKLDVNSFRPTLVKALELLQQ